jgi:hypothetical protein
MRFLDHKKMNLSRFLGFQGAVLAILYDLFTINIPLFKFIVSFGATKFALVVFRILKHVHVLIYSMLGPIVLTLWVDNLKAT